MALQACQRVEIFDKHIREAQKILADYIDPSNTNRDPVKTNDEPLGVLDHKELMYAQQNRAMPRPSLVE